MPAKPIITLPWKEIAKMCNFLIARRGIEFKTFVTEIGYPETSLSQVHHWVRGSKEPKRAAAMKIAEWCEKNQ